MTQALCNPSMRASSIVSVFLFLWNISKREEPTFGSHDTLFHSIQTSQHTSSLLQLHRSLKLLSYQSQPFSNWTSWLQKEFSKSVGFEILKFLVLVVRLLYLPIENRRTVNIMVKWDYGSLLLCCLLLPVLVDDRFILVHWWGVFYHNQNHCTCGKVWK